MNNSPISYFFCNKPIKFRLGLFFCEFNNHSPFWVRTRVFL